VQKNGGYYALLGIGVAQGTGEQHSPLGSVLTQRIAVRTKLAAQAELARQSAGQKALALSLRV
jgi:hypothetical protein